MFIRVSLSVCGYSFAAGSPLSLLMEVDVRGKQHALQWLTRCV